LCVFLAGNNQFYIFEQPDALLCRTSKLQILQPKKTNFSTQQNLTGLEFCNLDIFWMLVVGGLELNLLAFFSVF